MPNVNKDPIYDIRRAFSYALQHHQVCGDHKAIVDVAAELLPEFFRQTLAVVDDAQINRWRDELSALVARVAEMRSSQREYFRTRSGASLSNSKRLEKEVDEMLQRCRDKLNDTGQRELF